MIDNILDNLMRVSVSLIMIGLAGVCIRLAHLMWLD